jgi:hypothetical protein
MCHIKNIYNLSWLIWIMPVFSPIWEAEIEGPWFEASLSKQI